MKSVMVDGSAIRKARELAGYGVGELAKKLGVDRSALSHWEAGTKQPSPPNFKKLCKALRADRDSLLAVSDDKAA